MSKGPGDFQFEALTLSNAAGGRGEELFQECLNEVVEIEHQRHRFAGGGKGGHFKAKVVIEFEFEMSNDPDNEIKTLSVAAVTKRPKRKSVGCAVHEQAGVLLTQPGLHQEEMFDGAGPIPINKTKGDRS
jgi:hypothetical protein